MNLAGCLEIQAKTSPGGVALIKPGFFGQSLSFSALMELSQDLGSFFKARGIKEGDRVLLLLKPSFELYASVFALMGLGAVMVLIDPGMGRKSFLTCVEKARCDALVAPRGLRWLTRFFPRAFASIKIKLTPNSRKGKPWPLFKAQADSPCAVVFTSGGTGTPKGVAYTVGQFWAQKELIRDIFQLSPKDRDLSGFPLFSLISLCLGVPTVIAPLNPSRPAQACPKKLLGAIQNHGVTFASGSPAIWLRFGRYLKEQALPLPKSLRALALFGAPVPIELHRLFQGIDLYTPYGATECLPVTLIASQEVLSETYQRTRLGAGVCVGRPVPQTQILIAPLEGEPRALPPFEVGEILASGPQMTLAYDQNPEATQVSKVKAQGQLWHRMGDLGYVDQVGRLWFCGRRVHRVLGLDSICVESAFLEHPEVEKAALIEHRDKPAIVIERKDRRIKGRGMEGFFQELETLAQAHPKAWPIKAFFLHPKLPVDPRHNIKIDRLALGREFGSSG
jgi:acyl-CoA synthetase (AMP-forming)/AMP-acid ligase II